METKAISINDLISSQEKDDNGSVFPTDLSKGEASWLSPATTLLSGRILQSERSQPLLAISAVVPVITCAGSPSLIPYASLLIGLGNQGLLGTITPDYCNLPCQYYTFSNVSNPTSYGSGGLSYNWSGGGIASLVSGGTSSTSTWQAKANGFGTALASVSMSGGPYDCEESADIDIEPSYMAIESDFSGHARAAKLRLSGV